MKPHNLFTYLKSNYIKNVFFVSDSIYKFFLHLEILFRKLLKVCRERKVKYMSKEIIKKIERLNIQLDCDSSFCHNIKQNIIKRFVMFRMKNTSMLDRKKKKVFNPSSRSMN